MKLLIFISILLYGCGSENHGYGWEYDYKWNGMRVRGESQLTPDEIYSVYEKAVQCFGDKPPPFIIFVPEVLDNEACGRTYINPLLIIISTNKKCESNLKLINHEFVHYDNIRGHNKDFLAGLNCLTNS